MTEELPWPLRHIVDESGRDTGFCFVRGPVNQQGMPAYDILAQKYRFMGLTSMGPYPLYHEGYMPVPDGETLQDGWKRPYVIPCEAWAHCFRDPRHYLPPDRPWELLGGSDFTDPVRVWNTGAHGREQGKRWDLVYSCLENRFNEMQKNWEFAKACIQHLVSELRLRVLLIGRAGTSDLPQIEGVEAREFQLWSEFLQCMARARVAFFPNLLDASPRVMTEAMSLNLPVLVNKRILGGWKYVTPETGEFFDDESNVVPAALRVLSGGYEPRDWFAGHHGKDWAERRLAELLRRVEPMGERRPIAAQATRARFVGNL